MEEFQWRRLEVGSPLWGAFFAEQVRNDEVRAERQLGLWGLGDGTPGWYFLRDPGLVFPLCVPLFPHFN